MKIAIISDIHANLNALNKVLKEIDKLNIDTLVCLGDIVGYGAEANEVSNLIRKNCDFVVLGNHDASVIGKLDYTYHYKAAKDAIDWTRNILTEDNLEWLISLPYKIKIKDISFTHGSPVSPEDFLYVYNSSHANLLSQHYDDLCKFSFVGHSHLVKGYAFSKILSDEFRLPRTGFLKNNKYLFSVGSVGQPRDGSPLSAFFTYDTLEELVEVHRVYYDIEPTARKILDAGLSPNFAKRLFLGI
jgi:predicted phosphodiesterase